MDKYEIIIKGDDIRVVIYSNDLPEDVINICNNEYFIKELNDLIHLNHD